MFKMAMRDGEKTSFGPQNRRNNTVLSSCLFFFFFEPKSRAEEAGNPEMPVGIEKQTNKQKAQTKTHSKKMAV